LNDNEIQELVLQDPFKMGFLGVKKALEVIQGKTIEPRIDAGVILVTPENMNASAI
jgi:ribose transport system substrate-binding protein